MQRIGEEREPTSVGQLVSRPGASLRWAVDPLKVYAEYQVATSVHTCAWGILWTISYSSCPVVTVVFLGIWQSIHRFHGGGLH